MQSMRRCARALLERREGKDEADGGVMSSRFATRLRSCPSDGGVEVWGAGHWLKMPNAL